MATTSMRAVDVYVDADGDSPIPEASSSTSAAMTIAPSGPVCAYGPRLAYTYFRAPAPSPEILNQHQSDVHFFTVDDQLLYLSFFQDSGPLNAACLYRFCLHVHTLLEDASLKSKRVVLYSSDEPDKKANAALLIALYAMVVMRWTPADVLHPIATLELQPYRDAGYSRADYHLSLQSTLFGIHRAIQCHLLDLATFDLAAYETYEKVENGDWNWITPGFVAFASPVEAGYAAGASKGKQPSTKITKSFKNVLEEFEKKGVKAIVRLNKKLYAKEHFESRGMEHIEMYFDDGTNPTLEMTREFIDLAERVFAKGGAVAVHCKAGLGRTGTLIGAWLIYKHGFTASEAIGFMRLMRPGSCVGPQQHYLYENQMTWIRWAAIDEHKAANPAPTVLSLSGTSAVAPPSPSRKIDPRPITPPNEADLARSRHTTPHAPTTPVPRTPPPAKTPVPGQPRKTPGKSKHSVASPETKDDELALENREDLMLVKENPQLEVERPVLVDSDNREVPRSPRAVKDLASLAKGGSGRGYTTRAGTGTATSTAITTSPSKLPTRIGAKKRGLVKTPVAATEGGRSVRRRKSGGE